MFFVVASCTFIAGITIYYIIKRIKSNNYMVAPYEKPYNSL